MLSYRYLTTSFFYTFAENNFCRNNFKNIQTTQKMFRHNRLVLIVLFVLLVLRQGNVNAQNEKVELTLSEAIEIALNESNSVKMADFTIEKTGYAKKGTYASLYPNINVSGDYQRTIQKQVMAMDFGGQAMDIEVGKANNISAGLSATMPLVNAQLWKSLKLSALDVEVAVEQARSSRISMVSQVKQSFYAVLLSKEVYYVYKEVYDNAAKNFEDTERKYKVGEVSEYDYLRSQVTYKNAEPNVYSSECAVELAIWQLKAVMGIDLATDIDVIGSLDEFTDEMLSSSLVYDSINIENNSDLKQLDIQMSMIDETIKMVKYQYIPTLSGSFAYNFMAMGDDFNIKWNPYSVVGISLNIPIFDGFSKHNSIKQYKMEKNILNLTIEDTRRNLNIAIKNYNDQMGTYIKNYSAAESTLAVAQKSYDIAEKMYECGKATLLELNDAQLALTQAQLTLNQAIYDFMVAKASLDELMGVDYESNEK